ncbi:hypothetical protein HID58_006339 [Brassica napus]|uniref:Uncharacterized protein n=1 Tax=Brassica napus TaxID=3708 RepID=A0ABQ8EB46_BRANA|nr:hypothetical protein HID58_006339 [Brassica napus]
MEVSERKPYFIEEEDKLASSLSEMEAGCSGNKVNSQNGIVPSPFSYVGMNSFSKNTNSYYNNYNHPSYYHHQYSVSSPRSAVSGRFMISDSIIDSLISWIRVSSVRNHSVITETSTCTEETCRFAVKSVDKTDRER